MRRRLRILRQTSIFALACLCCFPQGGLAQKDRLDWNQIHSPTSENIKYARLLSKSLGYLFADKQQLFEYRDGDWYRLPMPKGVITSSIYVSDSGDIWAVVQPLSSYRQQLLRLQDEKWHSIPAPSIDAIKCFYFPTSDAGWLGATWGEILRFEKGVFRQVYSPSRCHINKILPGWNGELFIITDCQDKKPGEILRLVDGEWQRMAETPPISIRNSIVNADGKLWVWGDEKVVFIVDEAGYTAVPTNTDFQNIVLFPPGDGYHLKSDSLFYFSALQDFEWTFIPLENFHNAKQVKLADDGSGWIYGKNGALWALGKADTEQQTQDIHFRIEMDEIDQIMGSAILRTLPNRQDVYFVDHDNPNLLTRHSDRPKIMHRVQSTKPYQLDEPQRNSKDLKIYDFAVVTGDFNGDYKEDLFLTSLYGDNCLFFNSGNEAFFNVTEWAGLQEPGQRYGIAATADIDNDGDLDLFVPNEYSASKLYVNDGYGRFAEQAEQRGVLIPEAAKAACFGDIDADGWIDLAVTTYHEGTRLFRNLGNGSFEDVTANSPALQPAQPEKCSSLAFADYDNDGDFDLFICKMLSSNVLLQNDGTGVFSDVTMHAGVADSALSRGAIFFDPDHDGDLELFVSNMGHDHFYENLGDGRYRADPTEVLYQRGSWIPVEIVSNFAGGISNGALVFDRDADGDMDLFSGRFDDHSLVYINERNRRDFLQLRLFGVTANYTAVGATVKLFPAGSDFDPRSQLGVRMIESTSGYGSHAEKVIHFGVDSLQRYDAEVQFPGGARRLSRNLAAGTSYDIYEHDGFANILCAFQRYALTFLRGYRSDLRYLQAALLAVLVFAVYRFHKERFSWEPIARLVFLAGLFTAFFGAHSAVDFQADAFYFLVPLLASLIGGFLTLRGWTWWRLHSIPAADFESLSLKLTGFAHSEHYANVITSLDFHLNNFRASGKIDEAILQRFLHTIQIVRKQMHPDMQMIIACSRGLAFQLDQVLLLHRVWRYFLRLLKSLENDLLQRRQPDGALFDQLKKTLAEIRQHVRSLRQSVEQLESVDMGRVLSEIGGELQSRSVSCITTIERDLPQAFMPEDKLRTIVDELVANALRAMHDSTHKTIELSAFLRSDRRLQMEIRDHGSGIDQSHWQAVFQHGFTTKQTGGIGLFLAKQLIERYGGLLDIKESSEDGTIFRIILQRERA